MKDWTKSFAEDLWLKPDEVGAEEASFIRKALHLRPGQRVLDAPCGAGRIGIHLAHAGCDVTGVDLRPAFTMRASGRFRREKRSGRFVAMDLRSLDFDGEFHAAYSWLGSFGYFSDSENLDVMKRYARALRNGGRLLIDQPNRESLLRHFVPTQKNGSSIMRSRWDAKSQRVDSDWIVERDGKREYNRMSMRLYTPTQMRRLFHEVGIMVEAMYGSRKGDSYKRSNKRLIVVGRK